MGYGFVDKHRHTSMGCRIQVGGLMLLHVCIHLPYEYAMLGSLQISLYSHFSRISDLVFTCYLILEFLLAAIEMQSS